MAQAMMTYLDEVKEKMDSETYKTLTEHLVKIYKNESTWYKCVVVYTIRHKIGYRQINLNFKGINKDIIDEFQGDIEHHSISPPITKDDLPDIYNQIKSNLVDLIEYNIISDLENLTTFHFIRLEEI